MYVLTLSHNSKYPSLSHHTINTIHTAHSPFYTKKICCLLLTPPLTNCLSLSESFPSCSQHFTLYSLFVSTRFFCYRLCGYVYEYILIFCVFERCALMFIFLLFWILFPLCTAYYYIPRAQLVLHGTHTTLLYSRTRFWILPTFFLETEHLRLHGSCAI